MDLSAELQEIANLFRKEKTRRYQPPNSTHELGNPLHYYNYLTAVGKLFDTLREQFKTTPPIGELELQLSAFIEECLSLEAQYQDDGFNYRLSNIGLDFFKKFGDFVETLDIQTNLDWLE